MCVVFYDIFLIFSVFQCSKKKKIYCKWKSIWSCGWKNENWVKTWMSLFHIIAVCVYVCFFSILNKLKNELWFRRKLKLDFDCVVKCFTILLFFFSFFFLFYLFGSSWRLTFIAVGESNGNFVNLHVTQAIILFYILPCWRNLSFDIFLFLFFCDFSSTN